MSALPCQIPAPIDARPFDLADFISVREAARRTNCNRNGLLRDCKDGNLPTGVAVKCDVLSPGRGQWFIARSYDPRLVGDGQESTIAAAEALTGKQRNLMLQRADCARRYRHARLNSREPKAVWFPRLQAALRQQYPALGTMGRSTLARWESESDGGKSFMALADRRGGHQSPEASAEAWESFKGKYCHQNRRSVRQCWKLVKNEAIEEGWQWLLTPPSRKEIDRKIPPEIQLLYRDPERHRQQLAPFITVDPGAFEPGECWIGDHKQCDVVCTWRGGLIRPWITAWMDDRSSKIVGFVLSAQPNSATIMGALKNAIESPDNLGIPRIVKIDNGRDYDAWTFHGQTKSQRRERISPRVNEPWAHGCLAHAGIEASFAGIRNPNGKSALERRFRTLENLFKMFDSYTGDGIDTKPALHNKIIQNRRLVPTFEAFDGRLKDFIAGQDADREHSDDSLIIDGLRVSRNEFYAMRHGPRRVLADPEALSLWLRIFHPPVPVTRRGIGLTIGGRLIHYAQFDTNLTSFKALSKSRRRLVNCSYDPEHIETIRVYDEDFRFVCTSEMNQVGGASGAIGREHVTELIRKKAAYNRSLKCIAEESLAQQLTPEEQLAGIAAKQQELARAASDTPQPLRLIKTPFDGQSGEVRRDEIRGEFEPAGELAPQANPFALLRKNQNLRPAPKPVKRHKEIDGFDLLRRRFA